MANLFDGLIADPSSKQANLFDGIVPDRTEDKPSQPTKSANLFDDLIPDKPAKSEKSKAKVGGRGEEFLKSATRSALPTIGGITGVATGLATAPITGPLSIPLAFALGLGGAGLTGLAQEKALQAGMVPEDYAKRAEEIRLARQKYPLVTLAGEIAPSVPFFGASPNLLAKGVQSVPTLLRNPAALSALQKANLLNIGVGGTLGVASEGYSQFAGQEPMNIPRLLASLGAGMVFNEPTRLGQKLGFQPTIPVAQRGRPIREAAFVETPVPEKVMRPEIPSSEIRPSAPIERPVEFEPNLKFVSDQPGLDEAYRLVQAEREGVSSHLPSDRSPDYRDLYPLSRDGESIPSEKLAEARLTRIDEEIRSLDSTLREMELLRDRLSKLGKSTVIPDRRIAKLRNDYDVLHSRAANILTSQPEELRPRLLEGKLSLKGSQLESLTQSTFRKGESFGKRVQSILDRLKNTEQVGEMKAGFKEKLGKVQAQSSVQKGSIRSQARNKAQTIQSVKNDLTRMVSENVPARLRGQFLQDVRSAKTPRDLVKATFKVRRVVEGAKKSDSIRSIRKVLASTFREDRLIQRKGIVGKVDVSYRESIKRLLEPFTFKRMSPQKKASLESRQRFLQREKERGFDPRLIVGQDMADSVRELAKKPIQDMSLGELDNLRSDIELLQEIGQNKLRTSQEVRTFQQDRILKEIEAQGAEPIRSAEQASELFGKARDVLTNSDRVLQPMDALLDAMDGAQDYRGAIHKNYKQRVDTDHSNFLNQLDEWIPQKELEQLTSLSEKESERINIHLIRQQVNGTDYLRNSGWTDEMVNAIVLTPKEMQVVRLMRRRLDQTRPVVEQAVYHNENRQLGLIDNYFPIHLDKSLDTPVQERIFNRTKQLEKGFTKSRTGSDKPVKLDAVSIYFDHMTDAAYYVHMQRDIKMLFELANRPQFKEQVGGLGQKYLLDWLDTLAKRGGSGESKAIPGLDVIRRNVGVAALGFKASSFLIQPTSLFDASARIGGQYVSDGVATFLTNPEWRKFLAKNFPEWRRRAFDDPAYEEAASASRLLKHIREASFWPLKQADRLSAGSATIGAYKKALDELGISLDLSNPHPEAVKRAELELRRSQASPFLKDLPLALSRGSLTGNKSVDKTIPQFQSFMLNRWSLIRHDAWRAGIREGNVDKAANTFFWLTLATLAETGIRQAASDLTVGRGDSTDEERQDKFEQNAMKNALQAVPFMGNLISAYFYGSSGIPIIDTTIKGVEGIRSAVTGKHPETQQKGMVKVAESVGGLAGIPGSFQAGQTVRGIIGEHKTDKQLKEDLIQTELGSDEEKAILDELVRRKEQRADQRMRGESE